MSEKVISNHGAILVNTTLRGDFSLCFHTIIGHDKFN